jgi:phage terminase large subunit-like protein
VSVDTIAIMDEQVGGRWRHEDYCHAVEAEVARLVEAVDGVDPATPVPS